MQRSEKYSLHIYNLGLLNYVNEVFSKLNWSLETPHVMVKQKKLQITCFPTMGPVVLRTKQRYPDLWPVHLVVCINRQAWEITAHKSCA